MSVFYTYLWLREDGTPYYVGKGKGKRAYRKGSPPIERVLIQEYPSEEDTFQAEKFLISYYGRKDMSTGILINHTDGGEGQSGVPEETRHKMAEAKRGKRGNNTGHVHSEETRLKISKANMGKPGFNKGRVFSAEVRFKQSKARMGKEPWNKGKTLSEEYSRINSESHKGVPWSQARREAYERGL